MTPDSAKPSAPRPRIRGAWYLGGAALALAVLLAAGCDTSPSAPGVPRSDADSLALSPDSATVRVGTTVVFTVAAFDSAGSPIVANLSFSVSDPLVCTVDASGRVTGESEGVATLTVTSGAARDTAVVTVNAAARGWFVQTSGVSANLNGVFFQPDGRDGWAVGDGGRILHTANGGALWSPQASGTTSTLESVWFTGSLGGWAVGRNGLVLRTVNGGTTWSRVLNVGAAENLNGVRFATSDTGWVAGGSGVILRTFDAGATWQRVVRSVLDLNALAFSDARNGWAVGDGGVILGTHDAGRSWYTVPSVTGLALRDVSWFSSARANAVGAAGAAPRAVAAADSASWVVGNVGAAFDLHAVAFVDDLVGFAVGYNAGGAALRSTDGGVSWSPQTSNTPSRLRDVFFIDAERGWAVGENGVIVHTVTGGQP